MTIIKRSVIAALTLVGLNFSVFAQDVTTALGVKIDEKKLSYGVQEFDSSAVSKVKQTNFVSSLIGRVAGVQINSSSVGAGGANRVIMRGTKSLSNDGNEVLYILDGMPLENFNLSYNGIGEEAGSTQSASAIADINADDIESIEVLTGPAATALYGSKAANGAILITTKKGTEKTTIRLNSTTTVGQAVNLPDFQTKYGNSSATYGSWGAELLTASDYDPADYLDNTITYDNTLSVSTGGKNSTSYFSINHVDSKGVYSNSKYSKVAFKAKHSVNLFKDKVTVDLGVNYISQKDQNQRNQGTLLNPLAEIYTYPTGEAAGEFGLYKLYDTATDTYVRNWAWGDQGLGLQNPYWKQNEMLTENSRNRYILDAAVKWNIIDDLTLTARSRVENTNVYNEQKYSAGSYFENGNTNGYYGVEDATNRSIYADAIASYKHEWGAFNLEANAGVSINDVYYNYNGYNGYLSSANTFNLSGIDASTLSMNQISRASYQEKSAFASVNLGVKNYVTLSLSGRNDWSSSLYNLPTSSFFSPSAGIAVLPSEIFNMPSWVSLIKLRGNMSKVGNSMNKYLLYNTYANSDNYEYYNSASAYKVDYMDPEQTTSNEAGFDLSFKDSMFNLSATYYKSTTKNQTYLLGLGTDFSNDYVKVGEVSNEGFEVAFGINYTFKNNLNWKSNIIYSKNTNKIEQLSAFSSDGTTLSATNSITLGGYDGITYKLVEGGSMSDIYLENSLLTDMAGGYVVNEIYELQVDDRYDYKAGSLDPKYTLSFSNDFTWKNLNAGFLISARVGGVCFSKTQLALDGFGVSQASADLRDAGGIAINYGTMAADTYYQAIADLKVYDQYMYSATNVKLKELYVNYKFNNVFKTDLDITVGLTARDLFMLYCKAPFDPENVAVTGTYGYGVDYFMTPSTRNIAFNLVLNF